MPVRTIEYTKAFKKDLSKILKSGDRKAVIAVKDVLPKIVENLAGDVELDAKYRDHDLVGDFKGWRECHVAPDLLLIYQKSDKPAPAIILTRLASHAELF